MSILIGVAVFLVWYLVGLLTGLIVMHIDGCNTQKLDGKDVLMIITLSIGGPILWLIMYAAYTIDMRR